jgi:hypothetical protein
MDLYVIRRPSAWANVQELEAAGAKSAKVGNDEMSDRVRWIRSYVVQEPDGHSALSAFTRREIQNQSASMQGVSACPATKFSLWSRPSSSATIRSMPARLPEEGPER